MSTPDWRQTATQAAEEVYEAFFEQVIVQHVLKDREGQLSGDAHKRIYEKRTHIDGRVLRLMAKSGKGGWHEDQGKRSKYAASSNVTLLDHLLSVVRGALLLAALDWLARNPDMDRGLLRRKLTVMAVIAFLHDLDKDLGLERDAPLDVEQVQERMRRYGIEGYLAAAGVQLTPAQVLYFIGCAEASQKHRYLPDRPPPRELEGLAGYVALADKLDGIWLSSHPEKGGMPGVMDRLRADQTLQNELLRHWRALELFDPHHPFLLDELQRCLSRWCRHLTHMPPLIETHQDGRLFMLLPEERFDEVVEGALDGLMDALPFALALDVSNRGMPALYNGQPDYAQLLEFVNQTLTQDQIGGLFKIQNSLKNELQTNLDELLGTIGLEPRWPKKGAGALTSLYASWDDLGDGARRHLRHAACLALLLNLNLKVGAKAKSGVPDYKLREEELLKTLPHSPPDWLKDIQDDAASSRRTVTALWAAVLAAEDEDLERAIWGNAGLLRTWWEGTDSRKGFRTLITGKGAEVAEAVTARFRQLLKGERVTADEGQTGRCLFTDEPTSFSESIEQATGLYGVKVSAFSGRDHRPELLTSEQAHTNVGSVSLAEHKLRAKVHAQQGGRDNGVPALVSTPTTSGLFGGLGLKTDQSMAAMSLYDLSRLEVKKGTVLQGIEMYQRRYRMARLERLTEDTAGQVNQLRLMLTAARRLGRPLHVFRGLPTLQRAFFYFDALPRMLADLIGANELRLEQIPQALARLETAQLLLETNGLGYDVLRLYAHPSTRFAGLCLAWCGVRDQGQTGGGSMQTLYQEALDYLEGKHPMNTEDGALVRLGQAAAGIQRRPGGGASNNEEMLVFKLCLDAVNDARKVPEPQQDPVSLVYAVADQLETNLVRRGKAAAKVRRQGQSLRDGCLAVAEMFIHSVWFGALHGRPPTQGTRRILGSIYRMAFLQAQRARAVEAETTPETEGE